MGLDSVELLVEVENTFIIKIPDTEASHITTVGDFYDAVWRQLQNMQPYISRDKVELIIKQLIIDKIGVNDNEVITTVIFI